MTHACSPDFSTWPTAGIGDPVLAAIDAHAEAWAVYQAAPAGRPLEIAEAQLAAALDRLLSTPCRSRAGAAAVIRHLRWLIQEEGITVEADSYLDRFVIIREGDLSRFAGADLPPAAIPTGLPTGHLPPPRRALTPPRMTRPLWLVGETLAALAIIGGGAVLTGVATLL